jgi:hypothetical protein
MDIVSQTDEVKDNNTDFKEKYLAPGIDFEDNELNKDYLISKYPESMITLRERAESTLIDLQKTYSCSPLRVLHIIVGHKDPIEQLSRAMGGKNKKINNGGITCVSISPQEEGEKIKRAG